MIQKTFASSAKAVNEAEGIVEAYVNSMGVNDADGDVVEVTAFDKSIRENLPIPVLAGHDQGRVVGKVIFAQPRKVEGDEYRLFTRMQMNMDTEAGRDAFSNVAGNYIREWSVGFNIPKDSDITHEGEDVSNVLRRISNLDWVEVSTVIRGASPDTSTVAAKSAVSVQSAKGAIPSHLSAWAEDAWDGNLMRTRIKGGAAMLRAVHAWVDSEGDPEHKSSYKYLHHHIGKNGKSGAANLRAIKVALGNLNARRTSIPETDRRGVYNHLARHLRDSGQRPTELRSAGLPDNSKPFPNFHAVRIREPEDFDRFRTTTETLEGGEFDGKQIEILHGREKETGDWEIASFHLPVEEWTEDEAREWAETHGAIKFEPATGEDDSPDDGDESPDDGTDEADEAASDMANSAMPDTALRMLRLQQTKLAMHGITRNEVEY